ncbi:MAG: 16S rRNA (guanine(527)-N(7))-methyltransferase RsmG [Thermodesulfovibrionales bacterium]|nr:16S rRNA (guanine(527)-N(7))-methyltransferase RsmG [Thermodesulfovibrionales bacterium]
MQSDTNISEIISKALTSIGINPDVRLIDTFIIYLKELLRWNKAYNLTSITEPKEIIYKHFIDSLLYDYFLEDKSSSICDIGTGAGFPGIPLKILNNGLKLTLIEPSRKRCAFLLDLKKRLKLTDLEIIQDRIENVRDRKFDVVVSRALFKLQELIDKAKALLKDNGYFIISKGIRGRDELDLLDKDVHYDTKEFEIDGMSRLLIRIK